MHSTLDFCPNQPESKQMYHYIREAIASFIQFFVFGVWSLFGNEGTKIGIYYIIFVYILQGKMGKTEKNREKHATKVTKIWDD